MDPLARLLARADDRVLQPDPRGSGGSAFVVHRPTGPAPLSPDSHHHLIQVPAAGQTRPQLPQFARKLVAELADPTSDRS